MVTAKKQFNMGIAYSIIEYVSSDMQYVGNKISLIDLLFSIAITKLIK